MGEKTHLVQETLDLALAARLLILEGIRLGAVEVGLARAGHQDAREPRRVADS